MTGWIILGCIVLFFILLFTIPAYVTILFREDLALTVRVFGIPIRILPKKQKSYNLKKYTLKKIRKRDLKEEKKIKEKRLSEKSVIVSWVVFNVFEIIVIVAHGVKRLCRAARGCLKPCI